MNTFKKNGGFTLVELIIVIAILAILSTGAIAGYSAYIKSANNAAVDSVLGEVTTSAVLANAQAGGISNIKVEEVVANDKVTHLKITVTATKLADNFDDLFNGSLSATQVTAATETVYVAQITVPSAWDNSDYGTSNGAYWNGTAWSKGATAPAG